MKWKGVIYLLYLNYLSSITIFIKFIMFNLVINYNLLFNYFYENLKLMLFSNLKFHGDWGLGIGDLKSVV